jgi:hypothetical protein
MPAMPRCVQESRPLDTFRFANLSDVNVRAMPPDLLPRTCDSMHGVHTKDETRSG